MISIDDRIRTINDRIRNAALRAGRDPERIRMVAVTKTVAPDQIESAIKAGITCFGENYVQEAQSKITALSDYAPCWHFIGHLQTNKAKIAVGLFDLIHSVDSVKLAREINKQAAKRDLVQDILVQVNIGEEESKSGISADALIEMVKTVAELESLSIKGLMTVPPYFDAPERVRPFFRRLAELQGRVAAARIPNVEMTELSMGMTGDFEVAVEAGATLVRIGTAIFGERQ